MDPLFGVQILIVISSNIKLTRKFQPTKLIH